MGKMGKKKSEKPQHQLDFTIGVIGAGSFDKLRKVSKSVKPQHQLDLTIGVIGAGSFDKLRKVSKTFEKCRKMSKKW